MDDFLHSGEYELVVAMDRFPAKLWLEPLYDPAGDRVKA
jgi:4-methylaminobutanoate oxidase (formaldehyde-forming)